MSIEVKAFLFAVPLAVVLTGLLIIVGFVLIGENWQLKGLPIISLVTGLMSYFTVKSYLEKRNN